MQVKITEVCPFSLKNAGNILILGSCSEAPYFLSPLLSQCPVLYDFQFPCHPLRLRTYGHEVLTVQEAGNANLEISDEAVLRFAVETQRAVLTLNRNDFAKLHRLSSQHFGILLCSHDSDRAAMAERTHLAIIAAEPLYGKLIRVSRPA